MSENQKTIVSMIAGKDKLTLITISGELIDISNGDMYDTEKMVDVLTPQLTGINGVDVDLDDFLIIKQALFPDDYEDEGDIIVRVVEGKEIKGIFFPLKIEVSVNVEGQEVVIPEAEHLTGQMSRAIDQNSPAVANFLRRIAKVAAERRHSAEDLMKFIRHCDLPLTDAGDIIAYKRVQKQGDHYVDCHSRTVTQNLGYRVYTDVEKVDPDRSRACSNGLHVGSLQFMKSFWGGHTLVCLVRPEDFIAVPTYDEKKCRVCSYDIIGILSPEDRDKVNTGEHIADSPFNVMIGNAVAGNSIPMTHGVYVEGIGKVRVHKIGEDPKPVNETPMTDEQVKAKGASLASDTGEARGTKVFEKAVASKGKTLADVARAMFDAEQWDELRSFKKTKKKSYASLGFSDAEEAKIIDAGPSVEIGVEDEEEECCSYCGEPSDIDPCPECEDEQNDIADEEEEEAAQAVVSDIVEDVIAAKTPEPPKDPSTLTVKEQAVELFKAGQFEALKAFKKAKKKGWAAFGFGPSEIGQIEKE